MNAELDTAEQQVKLGENCFTREELQRIFAYAGQMVVQAAEQIYGGKLEVRPLEQEGRLPCEFCDYASVCMFDGARSRYNGKNGCKQTAMELWNSGCRKENKHGGNTVYRSATAGNL